MSSMNRSSGGAGTRPTYSIGLSVADEGSVRAIGERGNSLLKTASRALRNGHWHGEIFGSAKRPANAQEFNFPLQLAGTELVRLAGDMDDRWPQ
jgi:hypothetical protein